MALPVLGQGLGGAFFQSVSGIALKNLSSHFNYTVAYHCVFIGYGICALIGLYIILFRIGPLVPDKKLHDYVNNA